MPEPDPVPPSGRPEAALPDALLDEFVRSGVTRTYPRNTVVVVEGEPAEALYLIREGSLLVYVDDESGRIVELNRLGPGRYFGELMLGNRMRTASVKTLTPARLCRIGRADFERILRERPDLAFHVIQTLVERVRALTEDVRGLALMDVYGRVARLFLEEARTVDGRVLVEGMSQQAIATRIGASRAMVNRVLKDLSAGGYIAMSRGSIEIRRGLPKRW